MRKESELRIQSTCPRASTEIGKIAITGLATKTPAGSGIDDFFSALSKNDSFIQPVRYGDHDQPFGFASVLPEKLRHGFDHKFWGMTPSQASDLDPQTRWILEGVHNAILDSLALNYERLSNMNVGVYCGIMNSDSMLVRGEFNEHFSLNTASGSVAGTVSHIMGFRGPSLDINTMCSSGTVCLELACDALEKGTIDAAVVAAANYVGGAGQFLKIASLNALSKSGLSDCLGSFPDGYVRGEAMVTLILQRTQDLVHGQRVRCIVEAAASTHHGNGVASSGTTISTNTAQPTPYAYINSYEKCFQVNSSLSKDDVVYLELHATGTAPGDKAEVESVQKFYGEERNFGKSKTLWFGSNKSIFGHTEPVSGLLSIAKILTAFEKGVMPPTMLVSDPSAPLGELIGERNCDVVQAPLSMANLTGGLFGLTASGMSGTTTHVILRKPNFNVLSDKRPWPPITTVQAHTPGACKQWRTAFDHSWKTKWPAGDVVVCNDFPQVQQIRNKEASYLTVAKFDDCPTYNVAQLPVIRNPPEVIQAPSSRRDKAKVVLGFGGVGLVQYGVGRRMYAEWPSFRKSVDEVDRLFSKSTARRLFEGRSVAKLCGMIPSSGETAVIGAQLPTELLQPTTFLVQYAEAVALVRDFNVSMEMVIGHSFGEVVAAAAVGAITLEAAVTMTLARTELCMEIEQARITDPMGMALCVSVSYDEMSKALEEHGDKEKVFISGLLAESETLLSGCRNAVQRLCNHLCQMKTGVSVIWVESSIAFHCPLVKDVALKMEVVIERLIDDGLLFNSDGDIRCSAMFMTSVGGDVDISLVRTAKFWSDSIVKPIYLSSIMEGKEGSSIHGRELPMIDLSPRGLFVNWARRNEGKVTQKNNNFVTAPVFSWDFVRVLQHYRQLRVSKSAFSAQAIPSLPKYPFSARSARPVPPGVPLVVPYSADETKVASTYRQRTCFATAFLPIHPIESARELRSVIGVEVVSKLSSLWDDMSLDKEALFPASDIGSLPQRMKIRDVTLLVTGPLKGAPPLDGFGDPLQVEASIDFVDALQNILVKEPGLISGIVFVTEDSTHPAFEFIIGSLATLRLQIKHLTFVSTVYLVGDKAQSVSTILNRKTLGGILGMAKRGETTMQLSGSGTLSAMRVITKPEALDYGASWIQHDCLYVVTGSTGAVASSLLRYLAVIGVKHFLLLINRTHPSKLLIDRLHHCGAETVTLESCELIDSRSIEEAITTALVKSGASRVAGVFHLAAVDDQEIALPIPKFRMEKIARVKYYGQLALLRACNLRDGDIFSVPGSISTIVGSGGIGYAATNFACRALQSRLSSRLLTPCPAIGVSEISMGTKLWDIDKMVSIKRLRAIGVGSCSSQLFNLGMTSQSTAPTGNFDTILCRLTARLIHGYMNSTAPSKLFSSLDRMEEGLRSSTLETVLVKPSTATVSGNMDSSIPTNTNAPDAEGVLIQSISDTAGLSVDEVRELVSPNAFLDETFSIDSLSSIRLAKRIEQMGYKVTCDAIISGTYESLLQHLEASTPQITQASSETRVLSMSTNTNALDAEGVLIQSISDIVGLSICEVRELASADVFLDEAFSIDSLSSIRLAKRIEEMGYKVTNDVIISSTYETLLRHLEASAPKILEDSVDKRQIVGDLPISLEQMLSVSEGHGLHSGDIVPSMWYAMNGLILLNTASVKVTLVRMSSLDINNATVTHDVSTERGVLTFETTVGSCNDSYVRAKATRQSEDLSAVPVRDTSNLTADFSATREHIYSKMSPKVGFAYKKDFRALRKYEAYGTVDPKDQDCFFMNGYVYAEASIPAVNTFSTGSLAKSFFLAVDAAAQALLIGTSGTVAPAKLTVTLHLPLESWLQSMNDHNGQVHVHARYDSLKPSKLAGKATVCFDDETQLCTIYLVAKPIPAVIGSRIYPQFWFREPRHTLICFHIAGGSSRDFNSLADLMAPYGVKVLSVDFVRHGRRLQQPDEELITSYAAMEEDVMPWLSDMLQGQSFSLLGVSAGGACAFALARDALVSKYGLLPSALVTIMSQPPFLPNPHIERTWNCTVEKAEAVLHYYSILAGIDLVEYFGNDLSAAADRARSVQSVMHELTTAPPKADDCGILDIPIFTFGLETDTVVDWHVLPRWSEVCSPESWVKAGGRVRPLDKSLNHFVSMSGKADEVYRRVLLDPNDGILNDLLALSEAGAIDKDKEIKQNGAAERADT